MRKNSAVLLCCLMIFAHVCYDHPKRLWLDGQLHLLSDMRQNVFIQLTDFRHWNDDYQLAVCSFHFQPTSVSCPWRSQGGLGSDAT